MPSWTRGARAHNIAPHEKWWHGALAAWPLLSLLLLIDIAFIAVHLWFNFHSPLNQQFDIELDGSFPELFNYLKWLISAVACAYIFIRRGGALYLAWAMLFTYFLVDDSSHIHETIGNRMATAFGWGSALALRARDFGEIAFNLTLGGGLLGLMAFLYWRTGSNSDDAKHFTQRQLPWLGLLIFFGVVVDLLHFQMLSIVSSRVLIVLGGVVEDGGEMIAASFLTAISVREAAGSFRYELPQASTPRATNRTGPGS